MPIKHSIKKQIRRLYCSVFVGCGLARLPWLRSPALLILAGHAIEGGSTDEHLPADMKLSPDTLRRLLEGLGPYGQWVTVGEGVRRLDAGLGQEPMIALSMDDGYRDNLSELLPIVEEKKATCTVYLEGRPLAERRANWLHVWFWLERQWGARRAGLAVAEALGESGKDLRSELGTGSDGLGGRLKRLMKYSLDAVQRDTALEMVFEEAGGNAEHLCRQLYMDANEVQELGAHECIELGGHTYTHEVLSTLTEHEAQEQIELGRSAIGAAVGDALGVGCNDSFAYPFGRRWDHDPVHAKAVQAAGYSSAVTTHAGLNRPGTDRMQLRRWMLTEQTSLSELITELRGGFEWLRRIGVDLAE